MTFEELMQISAEKGEQEGFQRGLQQGLSTGRVSDTPFNRSNDPAGEASSVPRLQNDEIFLEEMLKKYNL